MSRVWLFFLAVIHHESGCGQTSSTAQQCSNGEIMVVWSKVMVVDITVLRKALGLVIRLAYFKSFLLIFLACG